MPLVPIGGLIAALPFLSMRDNRQRWRTIIAACTLGYASHAPLDVLTSYGTLWLWPFSRARLELDWMSIVDPHCSRRPSRSPTSRSGGRSTPAFARQGRVSRGGQVSEDGDTGPGIFRVIQRLATIDSARTMPTTESAKPTGIL